MSTSDGLAIPQVVMRVAEILDKSCLNVTRLKWVEALL